MFRFKCGIIYVSILLLFYFNSYADVTHWQIIPNQSEIKFTAIQNGAPVTGRFTRFTGEIKFDPHQLNQSYVKIIVDTNSVSATYGELVDTLKTSDWFNVKIFPQAIFIAKQFKKLGDKDYQADGELQIRNQTRPLTLNFSLQEETTDQAKIVGHTTIKRNDFGVGQGEWSSTNEIKNEVKVDFTVTAKKISGTI